MSTREAELYKLSGKFSLSSPLVITLLGTLSAVVLGTIYGYAIYYVPFIYLNFFITIGFGGLVGLTVGFAGKATKARSTGLLAGFGLLFGVLAVYAGWVSWVHAVTDQETLRLAPDQLAEIAGLIASFGAWTVLGWTPLGVALYSIWAIEALLILGAAWFAAWGFIAHEVFCERCEHWLDESKTIKPLAAIEDQQTLQDALAQGDIGALAQLRKAAADSSVFTQLEVRTCSKCQRLSVLTVKSVIRKTNNNGKEETQATALVNNLLLDGNAYSKLATMV